MRPSHGQSEAKASVSIQHRAVLKAPLTALAAFRKKSMNVQRFSEIPKAFTHMLSNLSQTQKFTKQEAQFAIEVVAG